MRKKKSAILEVVHETAKGLHLEQKRGLEPVKNIARIDNETSRTRAWLVRVQRNSNTISKMFTDGVYGGKHQALQAAIIFREQVLTVVPNYEYQMRRRNVVRRNNKSGIAGVGRYEVKSVTGRIRSFWLARWDDERGICRLRKFSVKRYGERKAKQLAIAERRRQLAQVCAARSV